MYLLDTNVLSETVRPVPDARVAAALGKQRTRDLCASVVSRYELRYGASLRQDADRFWARLQRGLFPVVASWLPVSAEIAERGGKIGADLRRKGREAGDLDPLLAAIWNGKTREVCTTVLPFQSLEHVGHALESHGNRALHLP
ncbi:MAG: type II toxin-antitoxin system VapC family toxin [Gammaproteobacteria bacterium]